MKYVYASTILLCLLGMAQMFVFGLAYVYEGQGLHPYIAGAVAMLEMGIGYFAAYRLEQGYEHE